ncbi:hypothetical protein BpHYR1_049235 [Brachionus plicatilis]|uniref:Uncharacterized protein n=1 Tax=Brachionus plicatilis TaxID=10195 RepID=A0A3M7RXJ0_BRAPC|nr:hypothetical protein BpHYR1_049235 [Brachionus plicatilis]
MHTIKKSLIKLCTLNSFNTFLNHLQRVCPSLYPKIICSEFFYQDQQKFFESMFINKYEAKD